MIVSTPSTTQLQIIFSGWPAPPPDGLNLWIDIDINQAKATALFHCQEKEVVGTHKSRKVTYRADHDCRLKFSNDKVFKRPWVDLIAHGEKPLKVDGNTRNEAADYAIGPKEMNSSGAMAEASALPATMVLGGPHIVVP